MDLRKVKKLLVLLILILGTKLCTAQTVDLRMQLADPTIFLDSGIYYLYGTASGAYPDGFIVYKSSDLQNWSGPAGINAGYALRKGDAFGTSKFWAPQIFRRDNKYYMAYTANEHIAIATADSPLGPFKQVSKTSLIPGQKQIDPFVFTDSDNRVYLYHVIVANGGNRINVIELTDDLSGVKSETLKECISVTETWENTDEDAWTVTEGPTVFQIGSLYYMLYSANHFRSKDYAVGYAVSKHPAGPWIKYRGNPIISMKQIAAPGVGHGDLFKDHTGKWSYVLHTHHSREAIAPRATGIVDLKISGLKEKQISVLPGTFRYLTSPEKN